MTLQHPRRIFRASPFARLGPAAGRSVAAIAACLLLAGAGALAWRAAWFTRTPAISGRVEADPAQVAVIDASTLQINGHLIRLLGVEPPPRGERCGNAPDCGSAAANALAGLVRQNRVACALYGADALGRPLGVCRVAGTDLNRALVEDGWARAGDELLDAREAEREARAAHRGQWAHPEHRTPPYAAGAKVAQTATPP